MYQNNNYLAHYGIKGMKWGVRRFQNSDGSYTDKGRKRYAKQIEKHERLEAKQRNKNSKHLVKELKAEYDNGQKQFINQPGRLTDAYENKLRDSIRKVVTDDDRKRIKEAGDAYFDKIIEVDKAENEIDKMATKYAKEYYNQEMKMNPHMYTDSRSKEKLKDFAYVEYGLDKAMKKIDIDKLEEDVEKYEKLYMKECEAVTEKLLGKYGKTKLYDSKYYTLDIAKTANTMIRSMDTRDEL